MPDDGFRLLEQDGDQVEAHGGALHLSLVKPCLTRLHHPFELILRQTFLRCLERGTDAGFDFHEYEPEVVVSNDIYFSPLKVVVAFQYGVPLSLEERYGDVFARLTGTVG